MFGNTTTLARSWELTKMSFRVIRDDKEILLFPLLAGLCSIVFFVSLLFPTLIVEVIKTTNLSKVVGPFEGALIALTYFGISFFTTFFNVCAANTAKVRFGGGNATFLDSFRFALSQLSLIIAWSVFNATVGMVFKFLDSSAERFGGMGRFFFRIFYTFLGFAWNVVSLFVVPAMVYENIGPFSAIQRSAQTIKQTWGESLVKHYGFTFVFACFFNGGLVVLAIGLVLSFQSGPVALVSVSALAGLYFLALILLFSCANTIYSVALYAYANQHPIPDAVDKDLLAFAFASH